MKKAMLSQPISVKVGKIQEVAELNMKLLKHMVLKLFTKDK